MVQKLVRAASVAAAMLSCGVAFAQQGDGSEVQITTNIFKPNKLAPTSDRIGQLKLPEGFSVEPFAQGLGNSRIIAVSDKGFVYVSRREEGDVLLLKDEDGDGKADAAPVQVAARAQTHGLAIKDGKLYLVTVKEVFVADIKDDGTLGPLEMIIGDLPDSGQHPNRVMAFGPDGMLYISVGSTCNACNESNAENATVLRATPDGKSRTIFASGLRNTIGFDWQPETGELWGLDHGIDLLGDEVQAEELNRLEQGKQYGWPHVFGSGDIYPQSTPVGGLTKEQWRDQSEPMVIGYTAHAAPMQLKFYTGSSFPAEYAGDAFSTMRGSWNRNPASGYEIVRVHFEDGQPKTIEPFLTGFLTDSGKTHFARPVGLAIAKDGSLLMADDANGVIYRIAYSGNAQKAASAKSAPASVMEAQAKKGVGVPLALDRPETDGQGKITVQSEAFDTGASIPLKHSEYADGVSPAIRWNAVPDAVSYAIIMEDPDSSPIKPFVHWLAWNIPGTVTSLPEGLQEQLRLVEPEGVLQGRNSSGTHGYFGPKPPVGDKAHRYHFQVLALDSLVDIPPTSDRDALLAAISGHVIGKGELMGLYQQKTEPPKQ
ncbi:YbhB/YbcL family Raf kinase inhibitor-like protein [Rhizobiales bacterium RZME27]|jgi:Raf kinase inhibitor-like YbhB/YbcL family protein|uniref:YbhB/YbcL family Raf kinase inhibitor-like protein n=1 Tax=Endobacterium cereale TaxID=2663029 RepID=A0A6A8A9F8_9HYPH|nr:YbhB/YbcL family Raf kinase inhibitor-like protein [Endobacterium cereale]MEB2846744.1 YbhB/YbcL family Raf kinase inhibitor-like protein [Endobacterium cereale]MQY46538.1 YbhB/YbcL family Raf kinase inhibitor-like protein [Endobacterium cereale]